MKAELHSEITAWLMQAGLAGESENAIVDGFCERCVAAGLPVGRAHVFIDTLHPVHEGRLFRWGHNPDEMPLMEYGRTVPVPASACSPAGSCAASPIGSIRRSGSATCAASPASPIPRPSR